MPRTPISSPEGDYGPEVGYERLHQELVREPERSKASPESNPVDHGAASAVATLLAIGAQAKLHVGRADDAYEREADAVASEVVAALRSRGPAPTQATTPDTGRQRKIRRRAIGPDGGQVDSQTAAEIQASRGRGAPLDAGTRTKMESAFGADFGSVRVHSGAKSTELNDRIQAKAFTLGSDVYFRDGVPDATSTSGQELLAHELTHTIQQGGAVQRVSSTTGASRIRRSPASVQRKIGSALAELPMYKVDGTDDTKVDDTEAGKSRAVVKAGDEVDFSDAVQKPGKSSGEEFAKVTKKNGRRIRGERFVRISALSVIGDSATPDAESTSDKVGGVSDAIGDAAGILPDIADAQDSFKAGGGTVSADMEAGVGVGAGVSDTLSMFTGIAGAIIAFRDEDANAGDKAGAVLEGMSSVGAGAKGVSGIIDKSGGGNVATAAAQGIAGFADAFAGIKDTFFVIKGIIDLANEASKMSNQERFKATMGIISDGLSAAKSGVASAKSFMDLWGGGAGAPLMAAVPGFGIALSAVDIIIRAVDLVAAMVRRHDMQTRKRDIKTKLGGEKGKSSKAAAKAFMSDIDTRREAGETISNADEETYAQYEEYLLAKGLQYISSKRARRATLKIGVAMGKMAGDIAVLGGASAPVGIGVKVGAMAVDVGASLFRRFKQWGRDKADARREAGQETGGFSMFNADKSTTKKLAKYNQMVDKVFKMILKTAKMPDGEPKETAADGVKAYINAMGLSLRRMDSLKENPSKMRSDMIKAMKKRE